MAEIVNDVSDSGNLMILLTPASAFWPGADYCSVNLRSQSTRTTALGCIGHCRFNCRLFGIHRSLLGDLLDPGRHFRGDARESCRVSDAPRAHRRAPGKGSPCKGGEVNIIRKPRQWKPCPGIPERVVSYPSYAERREAFASSTRVRHSCIKNFPLAPIGFTKLNTTAIG